MERRKIRDKYRDLIVLTEENDGSAQLDDPDKVRSLQASGCFPNLQISHLMMAC